MNLAMQDMARRTALIAAIVAAFTVILAVLWIASTGLIAIAVGILLGVLLDAGARGLAYVLPTGRHLRLVLVLLVAIALIGAAMWWGGSILADQASSFIGAMEQLLKQGNQFLHEGGLGRAFENVDLRDLMPSSSILYGSAETLAFGSIRFVSLFAAILFLGAFFAWHPPVYKAVLLSLLPRGRRARVNEVLDLAGHAMREWLIGQSISMMVIFLLTLSMLMLVGMPYPVLLAVQAGLLTFIPTLGPSIAGVVIILAGLSQSFSMAVYGVATYLLVQFVETHLLTPLVQERTVRFPPASTISLQVVAGFLFGFLGVAFAVPISAALCVFVEELYVKDCLGGPWSTANGSSWLDKALRYKRRR